MMNVFGEGLPATSPESEQGANAALTELEKGLRSSKVGEQAEAIVRFPHLFSQYPFPILINSGMLKLAELFRQGSNFLKMCVLRVCQQSSLHLDKVTSVDELVRRVITVINSNDPVARALTLRVLGSIAAIIPERKAVHHKVRTSLDSQDQVELYAAIYAANKFAARSKTFSTDICPKLLVMIQGPATSLPVKLKLLPIFQHMHHSATTAAHVRSACLSMLPLYPGQSFLLVALRTLTSLATHTLVDIPSQVTLLLEHLTKDPRQQVRLALLSDLSLLAREDTAHLWTKENMEDMVMFARQTQCEDSMTRSIAVVRDILSGGGVSVYNTELGPASPILCLCEQAAYSSQLVVAAMGTELLTVLACTTAREGLEDLTGEAVLAIESLCFLVSSGEVAGSGGMDRKTQNSFRRCLKCVVMLCKQKADCTGQFVDILGGMLVSLGAETNLTMLQLVVETLAALGSLRSGVLALLVPDITQLARELVIWPDNKQLGTTMVLLNTLLLQTLRGSSWPESAKECLQLTLARLDCWDQYRLGRAASRYGHHGVAGDVFGEIAEWAQSDTGYCWLQGLSLLSQAENTLVMTSTLSLQERLATSLTLFHRAMSSLRCSSTASSPLTFQLEFVTCRIEVVTVLSCLVSAATSLSTSPPPAIAAALAAQSRDELARCGRVTPQLRKVVRQLSSCAAGWVRLAETSFDADSSSLALLAVQQQVMASTATWIEMVCLKSPLQGSIYTDTEVEFSPSLPGNHQPTVELADFITNIQTVATSFLSLANNPSPLAKPISHLHTTCLMEVVAQITSHPLPYPRFFYQSLQQTKLKLAITPQPRAAGEPVAVNTSQYMAVKVEGVIQRAGGVRGHPREVAGVVVQLNCSMQKAQEKSVKSDSKVENTTTNLEQEVEPHNDFFSSQFLVPFPSPGLYTVNIDTAWKDRQGLSWRTGAKCNITVKSFEDRSNNSRTVARA
eukprot:TRINITY_DN19273_c0_g1_i1.p1 TRINITY_DN19273_c0_g1~~TRINITY_DN19273_c0_g1_i1.p1  ORF type:complete len:960 (-),score=369.63 TRINITY_DN19273_c0_g1_i1:206-3085(-)